MPEAPAAHRFPVVATIAPVVAAVAIWLLTSSPFALVFAALGPVTAIASLVDSRLGARRSARRELARFLAEAESVRASIRSAHDVERADLAESAPSARELAGRGGIDPHRWTGDARQPLLVTVGVGAARSAVELETGAPATDAAIARQLADLAEAAGVLDDAPVVVDARLGIGVVGPPALAAALARAIAVSLAWSLSPAQYWCIGPEQWLTLLPHPRGPSRSDTTVAFGPRGASEPVASVATAQREHDLPGSCRIVLVLTAGGAAVVRHPERSQRRDLRPEVMSRELAASWARAIAADARRALLVSDGSELPAITRLAPLLRPPGGAADATLACEFGVDSTGPVTIDLVGDGPHAVVGGTTGSGKSELLVSWVLAMAARSPASVTFLLVDFKGGAAFAGLAALPHVVGIVTDLDEPAAARALASLRAELRYRERELARARARDISEVPGLPRLVIVVDEFAAMLAEHPDLHALFADIAARGRSLGVHLVLCTQRPSGVVRDAVLANADLRISLRVNNRSDSSAVVGSDAAAELPAGARGRGILLAAESESRTLQFALASDDDIEAIAARWQHIPAPRRPWLEPLPPVVLPGELDGGFGLIDRPEEQRREIARYSPQADGHLLVLGSGGSGKSTALAAIGGLWVPGDPAAAWDALAELDTTGDRVVLLDDADSLLARFPVDHRAAFVERLARVLRDGPARGIRLVIAAQRLTAELQSVAGLVQSRLYLRHASRQEFVLAGGDGGQYDGALPPGAGNWKGHRVQVALVDVPVSTGSPRVDPLDARPLAIVSTRAAGLLATMTGALALGGSDPGAAAAEGSTVIGDVDEWQSRWGALAAVRPVAQVVFDGCTTAEFRTLTRSRELPPPLDGHPGLGWRLEADGSAVRVRLPR